MKFTCYYSCKYSFCKGSFEVTASSVAEAKVFARKHLQENGGLEGINYEVR
jgi:hypothetical protein